MAVLAYLFVECAAGRHQSVLEKLRQVPGVRDAHIVTGDYDIIAIVDAPDEKAIGGAILDRVHAIPGVLKTTTNLAVV